MINIQENVELSKHTVFKIGGPARYFCEITSAKELAEVISWASQKKLRFFILGAGSNVLVSDKGFDGLVIKNKAANIKIDPLGNGVTKFVVRAEAGAQMARVVAESVKAGLMGFEWAIGIPGTIGGSVRGNAGCFGSEIRDVVESVEVLDSLNAQRSTLNAKQCQFGYRDSVFKHSPNLIILSASLALQAGDPKESQKLIGGYSKKRAESQDIGQKCAGCIFKNVEWSRKDLSKAELLTRFAELKQFSSSPGIPAGFLIDQLGLKETKIGEAEISRRHANYFINTGGATAEEVLMLAGLAQERVQNHYGIFLEKEIQVLI